MGFKTEGPLLNQSSICISIICSLPEWFGIEEAILNYEREINSLPTFLAKADGCVVGILSLKQHNPYATEIFVMAIHPDAQRHGIGRALVETSVAYAHGLRIEYMQVKTLGPSHPDEHYARTRAFYEAVGFRPLEETTRIWDENNPCLFLVKKISLSEPKVGVAVLINKGDRLSLIRQKNVHGAGNCSTPGGHLDLGQSPEQCATREAMEEAGVEIVNVRLRRPRTMFSRRLASIESPSGWRVNTTSVNHVSRRTREWLVSVGSPGMLSPNHCSYPLRSR